MITRAAMARTTIDTSVPRVVMRGFQFPLGVYPVEEIEPRAGYTMDFEPADGGEGDSDWEEWPDRYMFDIVVPANRLPGLCRAFFTLMPSWVYPILDMLGEDAYREVDPYIAYDPVAFDRFIDHVHRHKDWLYEDGFVGFGAMSEAPFLYVYVDEHKIVTVRVEAHARDRVERVLEAFDIPETETLVGVDAAAHEHRSVLPEKAWHSAQTDILEELLDAWRLQLNIDRDTNLADDGSELGITGWTCLVRLQTDAHMPMIYGMCWLRASSLDEAEAMAIDAVSTSAGVDEPDDVLAAMVIVAERQTSEEFNESLAALGVPKVAPDSNAAGALAVRLSGEDQPPETR